MNFYDLLMSESLSVQIQAAQQDLEEENTTYNSLKNSIYQFIEDSTINSIGITALKRQFEDYLLIIDAIIAVNDLDIKEYQVLEQKLDEIYHENLNGSAVIIKAKETVLRDICYELYEHYKELYEASKTTSIDCSTGYVSTSYNEEYKRKADEYQEESARHQSNIDECCRIINAFDYVENTTCGFFQGSVGLRNQITVALQTMGKAFVNNNYKPAVNQNWRNTLVDPKKQMICYDLLKCHGVTENQISNMQEKGYSAEEILKLIHCFPDGSDRDFLNHLMDKEYEEAFKIDPTKLSDDMFLVMTEYSTRMLHYDRNNKCILIKQRYLLNQPIYFSDDLLKEFSEFEEYNNAILSSYAHYTDPNTGRVSKQYCEFYIAKITASADILLRSQSTYTGHMNTTDEGFDDAMAEYYRRKAALSLWATENELCCIYRKDTGSDTDSIDFKIQELNFGIKSDGKSYKGIIKFKFLHSHAGQNDWVTDHMKISPRITGSAISRQGRLDDLEAIRIKNQNDSKMLKWKILHDGTMTLTAAISPGGAAGVGFLENLIEQNGKTTGLDKIFQTQTDALTGAKKKVTNLGIAEANVLIGDLTSGLIGSSKNKEDWTKSNNAAMLELVGTAAVAIPLEDSQYLTKNDSFFSVCGVYDPGTIHVFNKIQNEGLDSVIEFGLDEDGNQQTTTTVWNYIDHQKNEISSAVYDDCEVILFGTPDDPERFWNVITGGDGILDGSDMESLYKALDVINENVDNMSQDIYMQLEQKASAFDQGSPNAN